MNSKSIHVSKIKEVERLRKKNQRTIIEFSVKEVLQILGADVDPSKIKKIDYSKP